MILSLYSVHRRRICLPLDSASLLAVSGIAPQSLSLCVPGSLSFIFSLLPPSPVSWDTSIVMGACPHVFSIKNRGALIISATKRAAGYTESGQMQ